MPRNVVVTGGEGFIGTNLRVRLGEHGSADVVTVGRSAGLAELEAALASADFVYHLAGINRPTDPAEFNTGNVKFTEALCAALSRNGRAVSVAFASSTQATLDNPYGRSKLAAENALSDYSKQSGAPVYMFRLTNVFGKWARPNYNSAVATFCHAIARGLPVTINDTAAPLHLLYVDDVVAALIKLLDADVPPGFVDVEPVYHTTVGEVVEIIQSFAGSRASLIVPAAGQGLTRALYATYLSAMPPEDFTYPLKPHTDARGTFAEFLRTPAHGQVSFFTAGVGVTRGGHYHHTKNEKFLVVKGDARFNFRHIASGETHQITVRGDEPRVVETVPGWAHDITNIGSVELVVMLWANEVFDPQAPDTIMHSLEARCGF